MLTALSLIPYISNPPLTHEFYKDSVDMYNDLLVHSDGVYPKKLLDVARPNEEDVYKLYRKNVYEPITKTYWGKILNTLAKIRRAEDFAVQIPEDTQSQSIYKEYITKNYPSFDSVENWFFTFGIKTKCNDPNGVYAIIPLEKNNPADDTEMFRPIVCVFNSPQVYMYKDSYCILLDINQSTYQVDGVKKQGKIIHAIDIEVYQRWEQTGEDQNGDPIFSLVREIIHNFGYMPAIKVGGKINEFENTDILYDSFLSDCIPFWNDATRRYSDHQVNMVLHLHPDAWEIADTECPTCKGSGKIKDMDGGKTYTQTCGRCNGGGNISVKTPFGRKIVRPAASTGLNNSVAIPNPPMGYAARDINSISFLKDEYKDNIRDGLAAINLENLMDERLTRQSGIAKIMDKQEQEAFLYDFFRDCVHNNLNPIYYFIAKWMFNSVLSEQEIMEMLPIINLPQNFNIINSDAMAQSVALAIDKKFSPLLISRLELEYAKKEMGEDSPQVLFFENMLQLDPLPNKTEDEKLAGYSAKAITQEAYIISDNLYAFIVRASQEDNTFLSKTYGEKNEVLKGYAAEIIATNKTEIIPQFATPPPL